ncbi:MAG: vitamin B12-dependent ribonucleotide reductase [Theionarchaea archaeon]|nr:MAG: ribonucleotide-diphosphate reductase subunit alpha [Theionarchaea archaeon DG-70-1]MBU7026570.1 vitamin B12-dependent ribonucleotide reductase [Theionarchaea archaeon]
MELSPNAVRVLERRYLKRDEKGNPAETPEELLRRVADNVASADNLYNKNADIKAVSDEFYSVMVNLEFLPNSPTLMNAGRKLQQLSACFVLSIEDSMESIFQTVRDAAIIHKTGGGTGFSFSRLRPKGDIVHSTDGKASGPVSFMSVVDAATEVITQGGKRRGANMGVLRIDHPDIMEFITCKKEEGKFNNFNISVAVTEEFMEALQNGKDFDLVNPRNREVTKRLKAEKLFSKIVEQAWTNGEPGIIFIDRINETQPTPKLGEIESTNPCGEQPLLPYESCNLGSINLARMVKNKNGKIVIDWDKLRKTIQTVVHFLDNVIDVNKFPLKKIEEITKGNRKIGLGVMGFADLLVQLQIPYDSDEGLTTGEELMKFIEEESNKASQTLAEKRGSFPTIKKSIHIPPMRNATTTTIAPTGSLSIIANCSSGIEPLYALAYTRKAVEEELPVINAYLEEIARKEGFYTEELMKEIAETGTIQNNENVPENIQRLFKTAPEINYEWHVKMQAAFQKYTDNAVSKTINMPNSATKEDIRDAFLLAYELGCKGITVYRDKSRLEQVLSTGRKPRKRPQIMKGTTTKFIIGNCGNLYVTVNEDEKGVCEVFVNIGGEGCPPLSEAVGRLISLALRSGIDVNAVLKQIRSIRCIGCVSDENTVVLSCPEAISRAVEKQVKGSVKFNPKIGARPTPLDICPECNNMLEREGECLVCRYCGYTQCE